MKSSNSEQYPKVCRSYALNNVCVEVERNLNQDYFDSLKCQKLIGSKKIFLNEVFRSFSFDCLRYVVIIMSGIAVGAMLFARHSFTTAMVSMVNHTALYEAEHPNSTVKEFFRDNYIEVGEFVWSNEVQQTILSGYMISYTLPQFFTTRFAMNRGLQLSVPVSLAICATSLLLTPLVAHHGWHWVLVLRLVNGFGASPILPIMIDAIENWMPKSEITSAVALAQFSCNLVYLATPLLSGFLASKHWKWTFYVPAGFIFVFCIIWYIIVADNPKSSRLISRKELETVAGKTSFNHDKQNYKNSDNKESNTGAQEQDQIAANEYPWYFMFRLRQFYPLVVAWILQCATSSGFVFLMPAYLTRILELPVEQIGYIHFVAQIGCIVCMLWSGPLSHIIQSSFNISITMSRNIVVCLCEYQQSTQSSFQSTSWYNKTSNKPLESMLLCSGSIVTVTTFAYLGLTHNHLVIVIALNRFFHMTNETLFTATVMDQYSHLGLSCLIFSMCNTIGNFSTVFFSWAAGRFLDYFGDSIECWTCVMLSIGSMNALYALVYICFCDSNPVHLTKNKKGAQEQTGHI